MPIKRFPSTSNFVLLRFSPPKYRIDVPDPEVFPVPASPLKKQRGGKSADAAAY